MQHLTALERRTAISLALVFAFRMLGLFMLIPVFAIYGKDLVGFSPLWIGLAIGAYGLTQAILQIPMGWLSDRWGRHQVMLLGLTLFAVGSVVSALADSVYMVTFGRVLQGMGAISGAVLALAADLTREEQRPKVMAVIGMTIGLSFAVAMVAGPLIAEAAGLAGIFWFTAVLAVTGVLIVTFLVPKAVNQARDSEALAKPGFLIDLFKHRQLLQLNAGVLILHLLLTAIFVVLPQQLIDLHLESPQHWQVYLPVLVAAFVLMVPLMILAMRRQQEKSYFLFAIGLLIVSLLLMINGQQLSWTIAGLLLFFVGFNYLEASMPALVSRIAPAGQKGTAMGIYASAQFFGAFLGGVIGGSIAGYYGLVMVFAVAAGIGLLWLIIARTMQVPARAQRLSFAVMVPNDQTARHYAELLSQLDGVQEATVVVAEQRCYLKVAHGAFNLQQAQDLLATGVVPAANV
ncbi:MFS transporter [Rheinheimera riviphila]|uniref:MFS transporter n=1 Tax=Rheinheimera riviphila TaxID=1834037 RepID=A0A437R062_9GAMM|nr:MFS transporter [Rheinheimera riviphila]RVU40162.1 MFS transporter [Rheinheimera riviphila]